ncbi:hypothetical protein BGZ60DRAFT_374149 [Tricladium varicosporioides]|nr:hypothetical protein BGZ60DRAFT_374149 [Hymenoscyphus varicosporioides]
MIQVERLLDSISRKRAPIPDICAHYFNTFHHALPIIDKKLFYQHLKDPLHQSRPHFSTFLLSICLLEETLSQVAGPKQPRGQLYQTLKAFYGLLQSGGNATIELLQTGIMISTYEHCQALHQEAWVSIGTCARIGHLLGLHTLVHEAKPKHDESWIEFETRRCTWWAIVVLERVINAVYENNRLPLASDPPNLEDFLPQRQLEDLHLDPPKVADDILLPQEFKQQETELNRDSSRFAPFATTIQATYLSQLVTQHVLNSPKDPSTRKTEAAKLEAALQHFTGACIPPPGKAIGRYCAPYGIRINALFYLHHHELDLATAEGDKDAVTRAIAALQSLSRMTVFATKSAYTGNPIDPEGIAFWAHRHLYLAAMVHIKLCPRDEEWSSDLWFLKDYLGKTLGSYEITS